MDITQFFQWIFANGGNMVIMSWILERIPAYTALASEAKKWIFFGSSAVLGCAGFAVLKFVPAEVIELAVPYFGVLYATFLGVFAGEAFHKLDKKS